MTPSELKKEISKILARYALSFAPTKEQYGIFMEEATQLILALITSQQEEWSDSQQDITFYAFRYALGRKTYVVSEVVCYLIKNWSKLNEKIQRQIKSEVETAIQADRAGFNCDKEEWKKILELKDMEKK